MVKIVFLKRSYIEELHKHIENNFISHTSNIVIYFCVEISDCVNIAYIILDDIAYRPIL